jgi:hypothetical protein
MPEVNGTLRQLWLSYHSGVMSASFMNRWLEYADHYEHHLPRRAATGRVVRLLEIGVQSGGSVQMWRDWFGAGFHYVGVDVDARCLRFARPEQQLHIAIGSQLNASFLLSLCRAHGPFDVIIDDAAHMAAHIRRSLQVLFPDDRCMATPSSLYVVEDLHTMMMPNYVELGPSEFDALSSEAFRSTMSYWSPGATRHHPIFGRRVAGVHLYDSIAFIDRGAEQAALTHVKLGKRRASFTDGSLPNRLRKEPAYAEAAGELKESLRQLAAPLPSDMQRNLRGCDRPLRRRGRQAHTARRAGAHWRHQVVCRRGIRQRQANLNPAAALCRRWPPISSSPPVAAECCSFTTTCSAKAWVG